MTLYMFLQEKINILHIVFILILIYQYFMIIIQYQEKVIQQLHLN